MDKQERLHDKELRMLEDTVTEQEDEIDALRAQLTKVVEKARDKGRRRDAERAKAKEEAEARFAARSTELKEEHSKVASALREEVRALQELVRRQHDDMRTERERKESESAEDSAAAALATAKSAAELEEALERA
uniref:Uncharacterized protein n=1 Tax=Pseudictyota dubia TaxID=2749911 RepID=A0A7R9ZA04_9STRA